MNMGCTNIKNWLWRMWIRYNFKGLWYNKRIWWNWIWISCL